MATKDSDVKDTGVPTNDAYTGMLVISLIALIAGSLLLYLDFIQYPPAPSPKGLPPAPDFKKPGPGAPIPGDDKKGPGIIPPGAPPAEVPPAVPPAGVPPAGVPPMPAEKKDM